MKILAFAIAALAAIWSVTAFAQTSVTPWYAGAPVSTSNRLPVTGGGVPSGAAGGDLSGTYPNPTVAKTTLAATPGITSAATTVTANLASSTDPAEASPGFAVYGNGIGYFGLAIAPGGNNTGEPYLDLSAYGTGLFPVVAYSTARGTQSAPTAVQSGDTLTQEIRAGWNGSAYKFGAQIFAKAAETFDGTHWATTLDFQTQNTAEATASRLKINSSGGVSVGGAADQGVNTLASAGAHYSPALVSTGSVPGNTGACAINTQVGGNTVGSFKANGVCTASTVILGFATTAPNGWACQASDLTTSADSMKQTATSTTSCTLTGTMASGDVVTFLAIAY